MNRLHALVALLVLAACTKARLPPKSDVEESVEESAEGDAEGDEAAADEPAAEATVPPAPSPSGGIISSGVKPSPEDKCKALPKVKDQKACLERLRKAKTKAN